MVFLMVNMCGYPAMLPVSQLDFMLLTDISIVMWHHPPFCAPLILPIEGLFSVGDVNKEGHRRSISPYSLS